MDDYPEHEKLAAIKDRSQIIGGFLEWMDYDTAFCICESYENRHGDLNYSPLHLRIEELLALHFDIDLAKIENEKRAMLDSIRTKDD